MFYKGIINVAEEVIDNSKVRQVCGTKIEQALAMGDITTTGREEWLVGI
jgi:hypothetical protein